jgi:hypothetical protein
MVRLYERLRKLEQQDAQKRGRQRIRGVYSDEEMAQVLPGEVVIRVVDADEPHESTGPYLTL